MFIFPCIYIVSFLIALYKVLHKETDKILLFFILGLPIYITSLSSAFILGFEPIVAVMQSFKEIIVLTALGILLFNRKKKLVLHPVDYLAISFVVITTIYIVLPLGDFSLKEKLLAFKSLSFFPFVYFTGRLADPTSINLNRYFQYICLIAILSTIVLIGEVYTNQHLQVFTGYAEFNYAYFGQEASGSYGLSWTFETANGIKRFASFFGGPLELGTNTLFTISVIAALVTHDKNKIKLNWFIIIAFAMTVLSIIFAFSRASFASYFIILYIYFLITERKKALRIFHYGVIFITLFVMFWLSGDIYDLIITTIDFSDPSSAYHVFQWLDGMEAIGKHPMGLGLGMAGRVSTETGSNIGGENQLLIIGVQTGIIAVLIYILLYAYTISTCFRTFKKTSGKQRKLALALLLVKAGLLIPMFTANIESYIYIAYITWFCTGLLISMNQYSAETSLSSKHEASGKN